MFSNDFIIFSFYENDLTMIMIFLLKKEGKCNWKELMQRAQVIEENIHEWCWSLKISNKVPRSWRKGFRRETQWKMWIFVTFDYVPKAKNGNTNVSTQDKYHLPHAPLEWNRDLSFAQSESNVDNQFKEGFEEPPPNAHGDFIQYGHNENVAMGSQWPQSVYTKMKEGCQHGINKRDDKSYHFTLKFQVFDFSFRVEFKEE